MHNLQTLNWVNQKKIFQVTKQQNFYKIVVFTSFLYSHLAWLYCYILFRQHLDDKRFLAHKTIGNEFKATSISLSPNLLDGRAANFPLYGSQQNSNSETLQRQPSAHSALPCPPSVIIQFSVRFAKQFLRTREFSSGCECMKTQSLCLNQQNFDLTRLLGETWSAKERIGNKVSWITTPIWKIFIRNGRDPRQT